MKTFKCYSVPLKKYLLDMGFSYSWVDINPQNSKTFWTFQITNGLSEALERWSANRPAKV